MLIRHRDLEPSVDPDAYVATSAVLVGDVRIAAGARILHGAVLSGEDGFVSIGEDTVVMENTLVRGRAAHPAVVGTAVMVAPTRTSTAAPSKMRRSLPPVHRCSRGV